MSRQLRVHFAVVDDGEPVHPFDVEVSELIDTTDDGGAPATMRVLARITFRLAQAGVRVDAE